INVQVVDGSVSKALDQCLKGLPLGYLIQNNNIIISKSTSTKEEAPPEQRTISGRVTDELGNPLEGVSIHVKGSEQGTTTDAQGQYTLSVAENSTLVLTYVGYIEQEVAVGSRNNVNVTLQEELQSLSEVVVTALG